MNFVVYLSNDTKSETILQVFSNVAYISLKTIISSMCSIFHMGDLEIGYDLQNF